MKLLMHVRWVAYWVGLTGLPNLLIGQVIIPQQKIVANDRTAGVRGDMAAYFGDAVAISGDYVVVGAHTESEDAQGTNPVTQAGAVYVFRRQPNGNWAQEAKIVLSDRQPNEGFGSQVALSGTTLLVSAPFYHRPASPYSNSGRVICFERAADGRWWRTDVLHPLDGRIRNFGLRLALDGNTAVISSGGSPSGSWGPERPVFVYQRASGRLVWTLQAELTPTDGSDGVYQTRFGSAVSLWQKRIAVGAWSDYLPDNGRRITRPTGAVYFFEFSDADDQWHRTAKVRPDAKRLPILDGFGFGVSVFRDRCLITVANPQTGTVVGESAYYTAYSYHRQKTGNWAFEAELAPAFPPRRHIWLSQALNDSFALLGTGSDYTDASGTFIHYETGSVQLFQRTDTVWRHVDKLIADDAIGWSRFGASAALSDREIVIGAPADSRDTYGLSEVSQAGAAYVANLESIPRSGSGRIGAEPATGAFQVQVSPNPVSQLLTMRLKAVTHATVSLSLITTGGVVVRYQDVSMQAGDQEITWPVGQLPTGLYWVKAIAGNRQLTQRVLKVDEPEGHF